MAANEAFSGKTVIIKPPQSGGPSDAFVVFLSSTIGDLTTYRQEAQDALLTHARVTCFLSESWVNTYGPTVEKCRQELEKARGFIGIFGYWYGSIPPGQERSITHLEFTWAVEKWRDEKPAPIGILMPESASEADQKLKKLAESLIPKGKKRKHKQLLKAFHDEVRGILYPDGTWKTVRFFKDEHQLREHVIVFGFSFQGVDPMAAATGKAKVPEKSQEPVTAEDWGLLGRGDQLDAFDKIMNRVPFHESVPAVAMLVHGDEDAGQKVFLRQLLRTKKLRSGQPVNIGRPPLEQYDAEALMQYVGESVGVLTQGKESSSPKELAELIHEELQHQQIGFILDEVSRLSGGVTAWYESFWKPLYARLTELRAQKPLPKQRRLIAIIVDYADQSTIDSSMACQFSGVASAEDYSRIWLLPVLNDISEGHLADWFDELDVPADKRAALATLALRNPKGEQDGTPLRVFDRLSNSNLWTNGEGS